MGAPEDWHGQGTHAVQGHHSLQHHEHSAHHAHHSLLSMGGPVDVNAKGISLWIIGLVVFTVFTEHGLRSLQSWLGKPSSAGNQMIAKVKDELMLMGMLSFLLTMLEQCVELSHESKLPFEWAHTLLFISAMVLVLMALHLLFVVEFLTRSLHAQENVPVKGLIQMSQEGRLKERLEVSHTSLEGSRAAQFHAIRHAFLQEHHLPHGFDFTQYLKELLEEVVLEFLEIPPESWGVVLLLVVGNLLRLSMGRWTALLTPEAELIAFASGGWAIFMLYRVLLLHSRNNFQSMLRRYGLHHAEGLHEQLTVAHESRQLILRKAHDFVKAKKHHYHQKRAKRQLANGSQTNIKRTSFTSILFDIGESTYNLAAGDASKTGADHDDHNAHGQGHHEPSSIQKVFSSLLLLESLYVAAFVLRYLGMGASDATGLRGSLSLVAAIAPLLLAKTQVQEMIDLFSFALSIDHFNEDISVRVLEHSYRSVQDAVDFRHQFVKFFSEGGGERTEENLRMTFERYTDAGTGEIERKGFQRLLEDIYGHVAHARENRLWRELNFDFVGGISFSDFKSFMVGQGKYVAEGSYAAQIFGNESLASSSESEDGDEAVKAAEETELVADDAEGISLRRRGNGKT